MESEHKQLLQRIIDLLEEIKENTSYSHLTYSAVESIGAEIPKLTDAHERGNA